MTKLVCLYVFCSTAKIAPSPNENGCLAVMQFSTQ